MVKICTVPSDAARGACLVQSHSVGAPQSALCRNWRSISVVVRSGPLSSSSLHGVPHASISAMTTNVFKSAIDELDKEHFMLALDDNPYHVQAPTVTALQPDICSFFNVSLPVSQQRITRFSNDLTTRDDAFGSLLLLLLIEGIVTTFLLRTKNGIVSNPSFSIKMVVELIREFDLKELSKEGQRLRGARRS